MELVVMQQGPGQTDGSQTASKWNCRDHVYRSQPRDCPSVSPVSLEEVRSQVLGMLNPAPTGARQVEEGRREIWTVVLLNVHCWGYRDDG